MYLKNYFFILLILNFNPLFQQEALRIYDLKKSKKTFSLKDLEQVDSKKTKSKASVNLEQEKQGEYLGPIFSVEFSKDDNYIFTGGIDGSVTIWNTLTGNKFKRIECNQGKILGLKNYIGLKFITVSDDGEIQSFNGSNGKLEQKYLQEDNLEQIVSFNSFNKKEENTSSNIATRQSNKKTPEPGMEKKLVYHNCIDYTSDKRFIAIGSDNAVISIYNLQEGSIIKYLRGHKMKINALVFKPFKHEIVSASEDNNIIVWDWETDKYKPKILKGHKGGVTCLAFPNNFKIMASGSKDNTIRIWNMIKDSCIKVLEGHDETVTCLAFTKDGKYLISGSIDNSIRIWNVNNGELIKVYQCTNYPITSLAISRNENFILTGGLVVTGGGGTRLWQLNGVIKEYEKQINK